MPIPNLSYRQLQREHAGEGAGGGEGADGGACAELGMSELARRLVEMQADAEREATRLHVDLEVAVKQL